MRDLILTDRIHTQRGLVQQKDLLPGDTVFEYGTGNPIKVVFVKNTPLAKLYNIDFNDGRNLIVREDDLVFDGVKIVSVYDLLHYKEFQTYMLHPFNPKEKVIERFELDPYMLARFLTFGKYEYEFINLPLHLYKNIPDSLEYKYHLESDLSGDKDGVVFFKYENCDEYITWKEFLKLKDADQIKGTFVLSRRIDANVFPSYYTNGSIECRQKMIAGIFDFGYDKQNFPYNVMIGHDIVGRLQAVQHLLWSLGITCNIRDMGTNYSDNIKGSYKTQYILEVTGALKDYPGFFYNIDCIRHMLRVRCINSNYQCKNQFKMKIANITNIGDVKEIPTTIRATRKLYDQESYRVLLEKPKVLYVTENYLPKVSL